MSEYIRICPGFGARLKELRSRYGMTMKEFGKLIGVSSATYHRYEKEITTNISKNTFYAITELDMNPADRDILYSLIQEKDTSIDENIITLQRTIESLREENNHLKALLTEKWIKEWEAQNKLYEIKITKKYMKGIEDHLPEALKTKE